MLQNGFLFERKQATREAKADEILAEVIKQTAALLTVRYPTKTKRSVLLGTVKKNIIADIDYRSLGENL